MSAKEREAHLLTIGEYLSSDWCGDPADAPNDRMVREAFEAADKSLSRLLDHEMADLGGVVARVAPRPWWKLWGRWERLEYYRLVGAGELAERTTGGD